MPLFADRLIWEPVGADPPERSCTRRNPAPALLVMAPLDACKFMAVPLPVSDDALIHAPPSAAPVLVLAISPTVAFKFTVAVPGVSVPLNPCLPPEARTAASPLIEMDVPVRLTVVF